MSLLKFIIDLLMMIKVAYLHPAEMAAVDDLQKGQMQRRACINFVCSFNHVLELLFECCQLRHFGHVSLC